jgi:hypothetical protein
MRVMVDQEVVDILTEIRERVISEERANLSAEPMSQGISTPNTTFTKNSFASLAVLERAWNRLPPVYSYRTGTLARLELWIKEKISHMFRWFTWEQVNFNAATHQTFVQLLASLAVQEQQLAQLQSQLNLLRSELVARNDETSDQLKAEIATRREQVERQQSELKVVIARQTELLTGLEAQLKIGEDTQARFAELVTEFRERDERLLDEQRVTFKQLSLELSESQVMQDRARRELDVRVAKLEGKEES